MRVVALIPARSGSKGLADKNIRLLGNKPLLGIAAEAARGCPAVTEVYLDSDSEDYLEVGRKYGARPFRRPTAISGDTASMQAVVNHFSETLADRKEYYDALILLYPVYPFRTSEDICDMLRVFRDEAGGRPLIGMKYPKTHPYLCYRVQSTGEVSNLMGIDENRYYRRQQYPEVYEISHWACVLPMTRITEANAQLLLPDSFAYRIRDDIHLVNIDSELDFKLAELMLETGQFSI